jgi:hypothetical protein
MHARNSRLSTRLSAGRRISKNTAMPLRPLTILLSLSLPTPAAEPPPLKPFTEKLPGHGATVTFLQKSITFDKTAQRKALRTFGKNSFSSLDFQSEISNLKFCAAPFDPRKRTRPV